MTKQTSKLVTAILVVKQLTRLRKERGANLAEQAGRTDAALEVFITDIPEQQTNADEVKCIQGI
jgi:hypothetical protein